MNILPHRKSKSDLYVSSNGRLVVRDTDYFNERVRVLLVGDTRESATFIAPEKRNDLIFEYTKGLNLVLEKVPHIQNTLMIGGAGFSYPKYYISRYPEKRMDVVEVDAHMVDLAMRYFYLDELFAEYDLHENNRLRIIISDGFDYLAACAEEYDAIFNDAYIGNVPDKDLLSENGVRQIKRCLKRNGVYALNLITALEGAQAMRGIMADAILKNRFRHVVVFPCTSGRAREEKQNCVIVASDTDYGF